MRETSCRDAAPTLIDEPAEGESDIRPLRGRSTILGDLIAERYELLRLLGEGASGTVYEAHDHHRDGPVAIKLLHPELRTSPQHVSRFGREVRALSSIAHSGIVRVFDAGEDRRGALYLVMELLEGELLFDRIEAGLETRDVLEIGRQLLGALGAAHARGVIHRDIKPDNLFLAEAPSGAIRLKILDFGIAKLIRRDHAVSFQTMDGLLLGTPEYMSPEVCRGEEATHAADLWSVATVLYHALTGDPPFTDPHVGRVLLKIVRGRAPALATVRPDLPAPVCAAIDRALDPDPNRRFPSAAAFATALGAAAPIDDLDWE